MSRPEDRDASNAKVETDADEKVEYEDVDDIIEIASELQNDAEDDLSIEDMVEIGEDLGLEARHVEAAVQEQERREEAEAQAAIEASREAARRKRQLKIGAGIAAALLVLVFAIGLAGQKALGRSLAEVDQKRAQVRSVMERKADVEARYAGQASLSTAAEAELAGALNRVGIEIRRYDEAAAAYNASASGFPASLWASLFGLPDGVPLSNEIEDW